jgi:hypothetical protein
MMVEAIVPFFSRRGMILLLLGCRRGEFDTVITTGTPFAWGEVPSSSSTTTSPSSSPSRLMSSSSQFVLIGTPNHLCWTHCMLVLEDWCLTGPVGKPQEEGMMSTTVSFPSVMTPRFNRPVGEWNHFWRLLLADLGNSAREGLVRGFGASINVEPAHNTTKILCPNLQRGCQSHWFADNKGLNVWCGKRYLFAIK